MKKAAVSKALPAAWRPVGDICQGQPQKAGLCAHPGGLGRGPKQSWAQEASGQPLRLSSPPETTAAAQEIGEMVIIACSAVYWFSAQSCGQRDAFAALGMFTT